MTGSFVTPKAGDAISNPTCAGNFFRDARMFFHPDQKPFSERPASFEHPLLQSHENVLPLLTGL